MNGAEPMSAGSSKKYVPPIERKSGWDDYDLKEFLSTLSKAAKIRKNKPLMAAIKAEAKKQLAEASKTVTNIQGAK